MKGITMQFILKLSIAFLFFSLSFVSHIAIKAKIKN